MEEGRDRSHHASTRASGVEASVRETMGLGRFRLGEMTGSPGSAVNRERDGYDDRDRPRRITRDGGGRR